MSLLAAIAAAYVFVCVAGIAFVIGELRGFDRGLELGLQDFEEAADEAFRAGFTARRLAEDAEREGRVKVLDPAYVAGQRRNGGMQ